MRGLPVKKILASAVLAITMLFGVVATDTTPAHADNQGSIVDGKGGDKGGDKGVGFSDSSEDDDKHNWKNG